MAAGSLPRIRPMLATLGEQPRAAGRGYELKWDGVRAIVYVDDGRVRVVSRNDLDTTGTYPELGSLATTLGTQQAILDGEIVAVDHAGVPSFARLQWRMHVRRPDQQLLSRVPIQLYVFDVLHLDAATLLDQPYQRAAANWTTCAYTMGSSPRRRTGSERTAAP
jgi:bifunctional non-homologous end joining protein LigD